MTRPTLALTALILGLTSTLACTTEVRFNHGSGGNGATGGSGGSGATGALAAATSVRPSTTKSATP